MTQGSKGDKRQNTTDEDEQDLLSALPEDLLHRILSFLPSRDLVQQTCMLARGWRDRWKSVPALRISEDTAFENADEMNKFVNYLVALRGHNHLVECEINFWHEDEKFSYIDLWIRYAVLCNVQVLRITNDLDDDCPLLDMHLVSNHLTVMEMYGVELEMPLLDFSSCSALQDLNLSSSVLDVTQMLSPSVKKLTIRNCRFIGDARARVSFPNLDDLLLTICHYESKIPLLDNMPQLVSAFIRHEGIQHDCCKSWFEIGGCADVSCLGCTHSEEEGNKSVILEGLSHVVHLELSALEENMFIFRRDLTLCPVFSKLKTLVVDDWCMVANFHALIVFLQHSPVLEKLTLLISEGNECEVAKEAKYGMTEQPFPSNHLLVEIRCYEISEMIKKNLKLLMTFGMTPEKIKIDQSSLGYCCSFASLLSCPARLT